MAEAAAVKEARTMSSTPGRRMKIGDFLLRRLEEADVRHLPYDALAPVTNSSNKEADLNYGPRGSATLGEPAAAPNRPRLIRTGFLTTAWPGFWCPPCLDRYQWCWWLQRLSSATLPTLLVSSQAYTDSETRWW